MKKKELKQQIKLLESRVEKLEGKVKLLEGIDPEKHIKKLYEILEITIDNNRRLQLRTKSEIKALENGKIDYLMSVVKKYHPEYFHAFSLSNQSNFLRNQVAMTKRKISTTK